MKHRILLTPQDLQHLIAINGCVIVDCRFELNEPEKGYRDYLAGHLPGARYANLNHDLSSAVTPASGRHPLPGAEHFARFLARIGWVPGKTLIAYDERNSTMAARLWWLMKYFGHPSSVLDGGLKAWVGAGFELESGEPRLQPAGAVALSGDSSMTVSSGDIMSSLGSSRLTLVDARGRERFSGETEPLDRKAGHIPGSLNRPTTENLDESGRFKAPEVLQSEFDALLKSIPKHSIVNTCGSGVTACHNALAMELAGLGSMRVYPGSWSEWIRDDSRPIETGPKTK